MVFVALLKQETSIYCTSYWSILSKVERFTKYFLRFLLVQAELRCQTIQWRTRPWPWIHTSLRLEHLSSLWLPCRVEQCNDSCDKENVIGFVAKKSESIVVKSGFFWSQCWVGGSTLSYYPPYFSHLSHRKETIFAENAKYFLVVIGDCNLFALQS